MKEEIKNINITQNKVNITAKDLLFTILFAASFVIIFYADYFIQMSIDSNKSLEETRKISKQISDLTVSIDKISLNTDVLKTGFLKNVIVLPTFPINIDGQLMFGKTNPFSGSFITIATSSDIQGGVRYTNQTSTSSNIIITSPAR